MPLPVSSQFTVAANSDANLPVSQVLLLLGNYMSAAAYGSTVASSGDFSASYPAAGAIDGDRTEINIGPAAGADNDVGLSSWKSSGIPDNGDTVTLTVTFSQARTINRIKLYHLNGHGLKTFKLSYWNGSAYVVFAATSDIATGGQTIIATTHQLDTVDFSDVTTNKIRLTVLNTQVAMDYANVVEIEAYRKLDVTDRVKTVSISRQRDYKLGNPLATTVSLECTNTDRFFSISHVPTTAEAAAGFVNQELLPGIGIIVKLGFDYFAASETVSVFVGSMDRLTIKPKSRNAVIEGRDGMKALINKVDSTKIKTNQDIGLNIKYILNRANISDYELTCDTTSVNIDYFFSSGQDQLSTIRDLVQAAADAIFYFDENGKATFKSFAILPLSHLYTSQADFEAGTLTDIATKDGTNTIKVPAKFVPSLAAGSVSGNAIISGGNLTLSNGFTGETAAQTIPTGSLDTPLVHNTITGTNERATGVGIRIIPAATGTITQVNVPLQFNVILPFPGANPANVFIKIALCNESGGAPGTQISSVVATLTNNGARLGAITVSFPITGGTPYWLTFEEDTSNPDNCDFGVAIVFHTSGSWSGGGNAKARFVRHNAVTCRPSEAGANSPWNDLILLSSLAAVGPIAGSYTVNGATTVGTWTSSTYDSFSQAVGTAMQLIGAGSYPGSTSATLYADASDDGSSWTAITSQANPNATYAKTISNHRYWRLRVDMTGFTGVAFPTVNPPSFYFAATGSWISPVLDTGANTISYGLLTATVVLNGGSVAYYTRSSDDGLSFDSWVAVSGGGQINSTVRRYLEARADPTLSGDFLNSPSILDITVNWTGSALSNKYPAAPSSFTFSFDSTLLDVQQEISDNLGGDSSIINNVTVQAQPLILAGNDSDTVWQGSIGTPPSSISVTTPMAVTNGQTITISPIISGGMDIALMSGANPAAAVVTFAGGGAGSWSFASIHPTRPVLKIVVTGTGLITDLRIIGKTFSNASYIQAQTVKDDTSYAKYGDRQFSISNPWIIGASTAAAIGQALVSNSKDPISYVPSCQVRAMFSAQIGDRVTVADTNLDLSADYIIAGMDHRFSAGDVGTDLKLIKVPAGL